MTDGTRTPILFVDVDGVISVFGFSPDAGDLPGPFHWIDGVAHCIPPDVGQRLIEDNIVSVSRQMIDKEASVPKANGKPTGPTQDNDVDMED